MKTFNIDDVNKVFFTSDTHFGHENIISFCHRPFVDVDDMDKKLIDNWNSVVKPDDFVFHLGDFALGDSRLWVTTLKQLNGNIVLIKGNHDIKNYRDTYDKLFLYTDMELFITVGGQPIYLNHYPFLTFPGIFRKNNPAWQLFGHVHLNKVDKYNTGKDYLRMRSLLPVQYEVGVDFHDYKPVSFVEVKEKIDYQIANNINQTYWIK